MMMPMEDNNAGMSSKLFIMLLKILLVLNIILCSVMGEDCSRKHSKLVRNVVQEVLSWYKDHSVSVPLACPLAPLRDIYGLQENNKYEENSAKWVCNFCGKSFYEEHFLDLHFLNRHPQSLRQDPSAVCLADWCDVFRCEVLSKHGDEDGVYWEQAMCREDTLQETRNRCMDMIHTCIPDQVEAPLQIAIRDHLNDSICQYLTCDLYWKHNQNQLSVLSLTFYIIASVILTLGACFYYIILKAQLSQNPPHILRSDSETSEDDSPVAYSPYTSNVRHRHSVS